MAQDGGNEPRMMLWAKKEGIIIIDLGVFEQWSSRKMHLS